MVFCLYFNTLNCRVTDNLFTQKSDKKTRRNRYWVVFFSVNSSSEGEHTMSYKDYIFIYSMEVSVSLKNNRDDLSLLTSLTCDFIIATGFSQINCPKI